MKQLMLLTAVIAGILLLVSPLKTKAQMMNDPGASSSVISNFDIQSQQQEEQTGKDLLDKLNNKQITCADLTEDNFEKIGEYFMGQSVGDTARHIQMNNSLQSMMGTTGEAEMHITLGKQRSGCAAADVTTIAKGGLPVMMGFGYSSMMGSSGFGIIATLFWAVGFIDLVLLGVWLIKQIQKK